MAVTAPPTERPPHARPPIALAESRGVVLTLEHLLYLAIAALAIFSRLYLLGDRALHHDETLHAAYSWRIYQGHGYTHDPLLHGPFLYYWTALQYLLFGDSDFTARLSAALFGIALVMLPWFLRRDIGRGAALLASGYLLISPVSLYVGRFIRHDIFAVVFELLSVIAILRYVATERPIWHYVLAAAMGLMLATMESFYLFLLIIGSFVMLLVLWQVSRAALGLLAGYAIVAIVALRVVPRWAGAIPLPSPDQALRVRHRPDNNLSAYFRDMAEVVGPMLTHPGGIVLLIATLALLGGIVWLVFVRRGADGRSAWRHTADESPRGTLVGALDRIPVRQWAIAFAIATVIYAVFYTALLSNLRAPNVAGLVTGVTGSFLYWLGQHDVQRGNQPGHYYLFQLWIYEPLLLLFGAGGIALVLRRLIRAIRPVGPAPRDSRAVHESLFAPALLLWWSLGALAIYSWAGEKMPWLTIHVALPLTLLAAWACARLWRWAAGAGFDGLGVVLTLLGGALILLCFNRFSVSIGVGALDLLALWPVLAALFSGLLAVSLWLLYRSARPTLLALLSLTLAFGLVFTARSSYRLAYVNGDVAVEPQVFVQTSPDVPRMLDRLRQASVLRTGRLDLPILFDNETVWDWYLRNYRNTEGSRGNRFNAVDPDVQAIFMLAENVPLNESVLDGFVRQQYPLRWWLPECEVYRLPASDPYCGASPGASSLLSRFLSRPWDGRALADMWQFAADRRLPAPLGSTDWVLLVRPELAAEFGISGGESP
jgi:predicted membrane-bound mannosyltransferase